MANWKPTINIAVLFCFIITILFYLLVRSFYDPDIPFLREEKNTNWILFRCPLVLGTLGAHQSAEFSKNLEIDSLSPKVCLYIKAFKKYRLWINDKEVLNSSLHENNWKETTALEVAPFLKVGLNRLKIEVSCDYGPPALWLRSEGLKNELITDKNWTVSSRGFSTFGSILADDYPVPPISHNFLSPYNSITKKFPILIIFFFTTCTIFLLMKYDIKKSWNNRILIQRFISFTPKSVLLISVIAWIILFINNSSKVTMDMGFDAIQHIEYVNYILISHSIPLANEGWQTHQPPLFYLASAIVFYITRLFFSNNIALYSLKLIPFFCGIGQIYITYAASNILFSGSKSKRIFSVAISAIIPMNIYMSHYFSNETLCALLMNLSLLMTLIILKKDIISQWQFCILGSLMGFAILTKISAFTIIPAIILSLFIRLLSEKNKYKRLFAMNFGLFLLPIAIIAGWFLIRNLAHFGSPIVTPWEGAIGNHWWAQPGYHTYKFFLQFGEVFSRPFFIGFLSFFDSLYSTFWGDSLLGGTGELISHPPWDLDFMPAVYILSIPASIMMMIGFFRAIYNTIINNNQSWFLILVAFFLTFFAILNLNMRFPYHFHAKAFFGLSAILPISLFFSIGLNYIDKKLRARNLSFLQVILSGYLGVLALTIFFTFLGI